MCGRNVAVSFFAARRRARPVNPVERCNPVSVSSRAVARPTGRYCPQVRNAHIANARGPIRTGDPAGASTCLLYTSDAADEEDSVDLGGRRIIKKKKTKQK